VDLAGAAKARAPDSVALTCVVHVSRRRRRFDGWEIGRLSVGLFSGPGGRPSAAEEVFDEASQDIVARVVGPG
jgi:hypothetical protein